MQQEFELTEEHLTLLSRANIVWHDVENGAPMIDPERPYGGSGEDIAADIAEILGWDEDEFDIDDAFIVHSETEIALQIVLRYFLPLASDMLEPSLYVADEYTQDWERA